MKLRKDTENQAARDDYRLRQEKALAVYVSRLKDGEAGSAADAGGGGDQDGTA